MRSRDNPVNSAAAGRAATIFQASSGLESYDRARFLGAPPIHGPIKNSNFGYSALFQPRLRRVSEVMVEGGPDLIIFMIMSSSHVMETWMDGRHRKLEFRRGDLVVIPPGMETRWCAPGGQASVMHLHVSAPRLDDAAQDQCGGRISVAPALAFREPRLQQLMRAAARLDELDPLVSLKMASIGAAALLQLLKAAPDNGGERQ